MRQSLVICAAALALPFLLAACSERPDPAPPEAPAPPPPVEADWTQPDPADLPEGPHKTEVLYGEALIRRTFDHLGPDMADPAKRYAGNRLACTSCHLDGGRQRYGLSFVGVADAYPRYMARENEERSLTQRINGCFERSMNGRALPADSPEIAAMIAYITFLGEASPGHPDGRGTPPLPLPDRAADPARGAAVYETQCAVCHGPDGQGLRLADGSAGYAYPPLWGPDSYNTGAGMHRVIKAAGFIRANMPFGTTYEAPVLSEEEAFDVAAYINSQVRPEKEGLAGC